MTSLTIGLMVFTLFWMFLFEAGILFLCYHTFNLIADIRAFIARGRGKDDSKNDRKGANR